jgi:hypothetical protein
MQPFTCWDCGFESRYRHGCLSVASVVCCHVEVSVTSRSLVQSSPTECGVSEDSIMRRPSPAKVCWAIGKTYVPNSLNVSDITLQSLICKMHITRNLGQEVCLRFSYKFSKRSSIYPTYKMHARCVIVLHY